MAKFTKAGWAIGVGLVCAAMAAAQNTPSGTGDSAVRKTNATAAGAAIPVPKIGCIDMERVMREYKKVEFTRKQIQADAAARTNVIKKMMTEGQQISKELDGLAPDSPEAQARQKKLAELRGKLEGEKEQGQIEITTKEARALGTIYKEIQTLTAALAQRDGLTMVVRASNDPITEGDPQTVMAAMTRWVVYADKKMDLTDTVIYNLNLRYDASVNGTPAASAKPKAAAAVTAPGASKTAASRND